VPILPSAPGVHRFCSNCEWLLVNGFFIGVDDSDWEAWFASFMVIEVGE
jgi:hypothetical protein